MTEQMERAMQIRYVMPESKCKLGTSRMGVFMCVCVCVCVCRPPLNASLASFHQTNKLEMYEIQVGR